MNQFQPSQHVAAHILNKWAVFNEGILALKDPAVQHLQVLVGMKWCRKYIFMTWRVDLLSYHNDNNASDMEKKQTKTKLHPHYFIFPQQGNKLPALNALS